MIDLRAAAQRHNTLLTRRLDELVPPLLAETGIDCWVLIGREYAEDPVLKTMLPAEWLTARRRIILVLTKADRLAVSRYPIGDIFTSAWDPECEPDQWTALAHILTDLDPTTIGIGMSPDQAHADGLTATEHYALMHSLPDHLSKRVVPADGPGIRWLETRLPDERKTYETAAATAHAILRRGLSSDAITPGITTTEDLVWWYRETTYNEGLETWFHPTVAVQRPETIGSDVIQRGDLVHVDFGVVSLGLCTDQQEHAYVLREGERSAPRGIASGIHRANRAQDILMGEFVSGRSGNEILAAALDQCQREELDATIYTHSIGYHGHGAGMTIGLWDHQQGVPGAGDHQLHPNTAYSIELMCSALLPGWGDTPVKFMLEQDAWFDESGCTWLDGRQENVWLI